MRCAKWPSLCPSACAASNHASTAPRPRGPPGPHLQQQNTGAHLWGEDEACHWVLLNRLWSGISKGQLPSQRCVQDTTNGPNVHGRAIGGCSDVQAWVHRLGGVRKQLGC